MNHSSIRVTLSNVCFVGWPGAHHSVDICEDLEEWSGGRDAFHPSDTEEEVLVQLVPDSFAFVLVSRQIQGFG